MARVNVYLPDGLYQRLLTAKPYLSKSVSAIIQDALEAELQKAAQIALLETSRATEKSEHHAV